MSLGVVLGQMLVLLAMMAIGFWCYKKSWITDETSGHLSKLVVNVFNPILVINGVLGQTNVAAGKSVVWNLIFIVSYFVILLVIGYLMPFILQAPARTKSIYRLMSIFSNVGFMGIPVIRSIFGNDAMIYVAFYILAYNIMIYTCGMHLSKKAGEENRVHGFSYLQAVAANGEAKKTRVKAEQEQAAVRGPLKMKHTNAFVTFLKQMLNPGVVAATLAVVIFVTGVKLPEPVCTFCDYMGNTTIPISMLLIGVSMAQANAKEVFADFRVYAFVAIRMIALPIIMALVLKGVVTAYAIEPMVFGIFIIELGMPVGSIIALMARENGADTTYCTKGVVLSTLASIITIPVICMFL